MLRLRRLQAHLHDHHSLKALLLRLVPHEGFPDSQPHCSTGCERLLTADGGSASGRAAFAGASSTLDKRHERTS